MLCSFKCLIERSIFSISLDQVTEYFLIFYQFRKQRNVIHFTNKVKLPKSNFLNSSRCTFFIFSFLKCIENYVNLETIFALNIFQICKYYQMMFIYLKILLRSSSCPCCTVSNVLQIDLLLLYLSF